MLANTSDHADLSTLDGEERGEALDPLIHERLPMDEDERVDLALCYDIRSQHGLPGARGRDEYADVVRKQGLGSARLFEYGVPLAVAPGADADAGGAGEPKPLLPVPPAKPKGSKLKKWTCPCGVNVRVAIAEFEATCNKCGGRFVRG